jgi:hypothetical protein
MGLMSPLVVIKGVGCNLAFSRFFEREKVPDRADEGPHSLSWGVMQELHLDCKGRRLSQCVTPLSGAAD